MSDDGNKGVLAALGAVFLMALLLFVSPLVGTLTGMFVGWVVGLFLSDQLLAAFAAFGIKGLPLWQLGALLGFVGGFFRVNLARK